VSGSIAIQDVRTWTGGTLVAGPDTGTCRGVTIDSRTVEAGLLFVAIRGPRHDAHDFLVGAARDGASALLVERAEFARRAIARELPAAVTVIAVDDTTRALSALAAGHRRSFRGPLVAITGSNGKTTTKEMCAAVLSVRTPCLKTEGNLNNEFGLPLTLLRLAPGHRAAVIEIGMNHAGESAPLAAVAAPTIGLVTNVGTAHIEYLGSQEAIAIEKGALFEALGPDGIAIANVDDARVVAQLARTRARRLGFGRSAGADVRSEAETALPDGGVAFELVTPAGRAPVRVHAVGTVLVINALAAAAGALAAGASLDDIVTGLGRYRAPAGRMERLALARDVIVLNDSYNANPQSMEVALRSLAELKGERRGIAVLGDMGELGPIAREAHRTAGRLTAELGIELLFALGASADEVVAGALAAGMAPECATASRDAEALARSIQAALRPSDWVLVKGSRSMRMERIVQALAPPDGRAPCGAAAAPEAHR
jgi:UDP-N-acetylmuramoyl-tripeptide--D-alanyl-D-alanine ligase